MKILSSLWSVLSTMGPAPAKAPEGPKSLEPGERGMFEDPEGEPEAPQEEPEEEPEETPEEEPEETPRAEREESDEDEDEEEAPAEEDADEEEDDTALSLRESWETRLEADARANPEAAPRLNLGQTGLREAARKKFEELREKDPDGKFDADAMFEVALDAALQVVGSYHDGVAAPAGDRVEKGLRNVQVGRTLTSFRKEAGERLTEGVERKMADLYQGFATKYGWRRADKVPLKTLFRMAGGSLKGGKAGTKPAAKAGDEDTATSQKRAALGAAGGPRALGRTRPEGGAGPARKEDRALREHHNDARDRSPFFTLG